jgi:hypothetical protein
MSKLNQRPSYHDSRSVTSSQSLFKSSQSVVSRSSKLSLGQESKGNQSTIGSLKRVSSPYSQSFYSLQSLTTNTNKKKKRDNFGSLTKVLLLPDEVDEITKSWCPKRTASEQDGEGESMCHPSEDDDSTINSEGAHSLNDSYVMQFTNEKERNEVLYQKVNDELNEDEGIAPIKLPPVSNENPRQSPSNKKSIPKHCKKFENSPYAIMQNTKKKRLCSKKQK